MVWITLSSLDRCVIYVDNRYLWITSLGAASAERGTGRMNLTYSERHPHGGRNLRPVPFQTRQQARLFRMWWRKPNLLARLIAQRATAIIETRTEGERK